jgi:cytochrome c-type biogenesis protein
MQLTGGIVDYVIVFVAGVVVSFTPCLYPVLPITSAIIAGANTSGSRWRGFFLSLLYVLGLAVSYSAFAVIAVLTGKVFGTIQQMPIFSFVVANILLLFALVMFDVIRLPGFVPVHVTGKRRSVLSVFVMGLVSGIVVSPCTAPVFATLLLYAASGKNIIHSISLLFVFAYGAGASLILAGTFSGFLSSLPKSGIWMDRVKKGIGIVLLLLAQWYFIQTGRSF